MIARTRLTIAGLMVVSGVVAAAQSRPTVRLNDDDVKSLIDRIDDERDRFEDQLDGDLKRSILRSSAGEVNVERYLDDLQENVERLKQRFTPAYAASAEVTTVLRQGSDIQQFMSTKPPDFDGASEWNRLAASLGELAAVYGTRLPLAAGQQARRMNDRELAKAADELGKRADRFKRDLDTALKNDVTVDKATREDLVEQAEGLKQEADKLESAVGDGRPASGEATALLDRALKLRMESSTRKLSPAAQSSWSVLETALDGIAQAFNLPGMRR